MVVAQANLMVSRAVVIILWLWCRQVFFFVEQPGSNTKHTRMQDTHALHHSHKHFRPQDLVTPPICLPSQA